MRTRSFVAALLVAALLIPSCHKQRVPATHEDSGGTHNPGGNENTGGNNGDNNGGNGGGTSQGLTLNLRSDWAITYEGRIQDYVEADGSYSDVESFSISCPGASYFMVRVLTPDQLRDNYSNDLKKFFEEEEGYIASDAEYFGVSFNELNYIYTPNVTTLLLDRSRAGEYLYYLVGIDNEGKISGDYSQTVQVFEEEKPSAEYLAWIGDWTVTNGEVGYKIQISQSEANWLYRVDGWETGASISSDGTVMDQEYIETRYDRNSGQMVFFSQYLGGYNDEQWGWLDEYFLGNIFDTNGLQGITDTNLDISRASFVEGSEAMANLEACEVSINVNGSAWKTTFYSMSYWNVDSQSEQPAWYRYNANNPTFPMSMTRTKALAGEIKIAADRKVNSRTIHVNQPSNRRSGQENTGLCSEGGKR